MYVPVVNSFGFSIISSSVNSGGGIGSEQLQERLPCWLASMVNITLLPSGLVVPSMIIRYVINASKYTILQIHPKLLHPQAQTSVQA